MSLDLAKLSDAELKELLIINGRRAVFLDDEKINLTDLTEGELKKLLIAIVGENTKRTRESAAKDWQNQLLRKK